MTTTQVGETSVTVTNSSFQNYTHLDDHTTQTTVSLRFKPFIKKIIISFGEQGMFLRGSLMVPSMSEAYLPISHGIPCK